MRSRPPVLHGARRKHGQMHSLLPGGKRFLHGGAFKTYAGRPPSRPARQNAGELTTCRIAWHLMWSCGALLPTGVNHDGNNHRRGNHCCRSRLHNIPPFLQTFLRLRQRLRLQFRQKERPWENVRERRRLFLREVIFFARFLRISFNFNNPMSAVAEGASRWRFHA